MSRHTKQIKFLHLRPAPTPEGETAQGMISTLEAARSLFATVGGMLAESPDSTISFELMAHNGVISYLIGVEQAWVEVMQQHLYAAYPSAEVALLDPPFDIKGKLAGATITVTPYNGALLSDKQPTTDTMQPLLEMLTSVPNDSRVCVQLLLQSTERKEPIVSAVMKDIARGIGEGFKFLALGKTAPDDHEEGEKVNTAIFQAFINVIAMAKTAQLAHDAVHRAVAVYHQFALPGQTRISYESPQDIHKWFDQIIAHQGNGYGGFLLTAHEAACIYHPPYSVRDFPALASLPSVHLPPPTYHGTSGLFLGVSTYRGRTKPLYISSEDRLRHLYLIGQTGTGKSTLFQSAILQDMLAGYGCCFIDPHGEAIDWLLPRIPKHRLRDVVLFDVSDSSSILGLNLLEWKTTDERDLIIQELIYLFYKLFDPQHTGIIGPQFEHWLRNAALTITEPKIRGTLVDIPRLFTDSKFQATILRYVEHQSVQDFWHNQMAQTSSFHKSEMLNYFTSKFGSFLGNNLMYRILSQRHSSFDVRTLMDKKKILLVNLSKGKLGSLNAQLLGTLLMTKIQMAALSRADIPQHARAPFYVYIDEFQNLATDSFTTMLSEIRKYQVALHLTHQYVDQIPDAVKQAIIGNVGTIMAFRLGRNDAAWLAPHFAPLSNEDLTSIRPYHYHIRALVGGTLTSPFTMQSIPITTEPHPAIEQAVRQRMRQFVAAYDQALVKGHKSNSNRQIAF